MREHIRVVNIFAFLFVMHIYSGELPLRLSRTPVSALHRVEPEMQAPILNGSERTYIPNSGNTFVTVEAIS